MEILTYQKVLQQLVARAGMMGVKSGLENMRAMAEILGFPDKKFPIIHVGGTNGKGSVSLKLAKALELSGYQCGLFTSPHLSSFRERICINGIKISKEDTATLYSQIVHLTKVHQLDLTYFEYCTLLAFQYFAAKQVDVAVIEVGLGGRLDATNIAEPLLSIVTSISLDHMDLLGHTEEEIAHEKAGIIKPNTPIVVGPHLPLHVFQQKARRLNAPLTAIQGTYSHYGLENRAIAEEALKQISSRFCISKEASEALTVEPPCRFEKVPNKNMILDVAHNPNGIERLIRRLKTNYPTSDLHFLVSFSASKDIPLCAKLISEVAKSVSILKISHPRLADPEEIKKYFSLAHVVIQSPEEAMAQMGAQMTVACGTFFIMGPIRKILGYSEDYDGDEESESVDDV